MSNPKINDDFSNYNDSALVRKADFIMNCMTSNTLFPNPSVAISELKIAIKVFDEAIDKAKEGEKAEIKDCEEKRKVLIDKLQKLALYVQKVGDGNEVTLLSSGYSLSEAV